MQQQSQETKPTAGAGKKASQSSEMQKTKRLVGLLTPQNNCRSDLFKGLAQCNSQQKLSTRSASPRAGFWSFSPLEIFPLNAHLTLMGLSESADDMVLNLQSLSRLDACILVLDANAAAVESAAPYLTLLGKQRKPHMVFLNNIDQPEANLDEAMGALRRICPEPVCLQHYLVRDKRQNLKGLVNLFDESVAMRDESGEKLVTLPAEWATEEALARQEYLEEFSDVDERVLIELLDDHIPSIRTLKQELRLRLDEDALVPVFVGQTRTGFGLAHLANALNNFLPAHPEAALLSVEPTLRSTLEGAGTPILQVIANGEYQKRGTCVCYRVVTGTLKSGDILCKQRFSQLYAPDPSSAEGWSETQEVATGGLILALKSQAYEVGTLLGEKIDAKAKQSHTLPARSTYRMALRPDQGCSPEKLSAALERLALENPTLRREQTNGGGVFKLYVESQNTALAIEKEVQTRFGLAAHLEQPPVAYQERISERVEGIRGKYKHQSGGHGAYGDVVLTFIPKNKGHGVTFSESVVGGAVPRQYFSAVEAGVREALLNGSHGYPLTDLEVELTDGSSHSVDSSEMAFRNAGRLAVRALLEQAPSLMIEPLFKLQVLLPENLGHLNLQLASACDAQIVDFSPSEEIPLWNRTVLLIRASRINEYIQQVKSAHQGMGLLEVIDDPDEIHYLEVNQT